MGTVGLRKSFSIVIIKQTHSMLVYNGIVLN